MEPNKSEEVGNIRIKVVGVGGGGSNAVSRMYRERIPGVEYMVMNTDKQALLTSDVPSKLSIGDSLAEGKGVGGDLIRPRQAGRGHRPGPKFPHHLFPHRCAFADFLDVHLVKHKFCRT